MKNRILHSPIKPSQFQRAFVIRAELESFAQRNIDNEIGQSAVDDYCRLHDFMGTMHALKREDQEKIVDKYECNLWRYWKKE